MLKQRVTLGMFALAVGIGIMFVANSSGAAGTARREPREARAHREESRHEEANEANEEGNEAAINLADAPAAVRATITRIAKSNPVDKITQESEDGMKTFEAIYSVNGAENTLKIAESGDLIEQEQIISASDLPEAARKQLEKKYPRGQIKKIELVQKFGYDIEIVSGRKTRQIEVNAAGQMEDEENGGQSGQQEGQHEDRN